MTLESRNTSTSGDLQYHAEFWYINQRIWSTILGHTANSPRLCEKTAFRVSTKLRSKPLYLFIKTLAWWRASVPGSKLTTCNECSAKCSQMPHQVASAREVQRITSRWMCFHQNAKPKVNYWCSPMDLLFLGSHSSGYIYNLILNQSGAAYEDHTVGSWNSVPGAFDHPVVTFEHLQWVRRLSFIFSRFFNLD